MKNNINKTDNLYIFISFYIDDGTPHERITRNIQNIMKELFEPDTYHKEYFSDHGKGYEIVYRIKKPAITDSADDMKKFFHSLAKIFYHFSEMSPHFTQVGTIKD